MIQSKTEKDDSFKRCVLQYKAICYNMSSCENINMLPGRIFPILYIIPQPVVSDWSLTSGAHYHAIFYCDNLIRRTTITHSLKS